MTRSNRTHFGGVTDSKSSLKPKHLTKQEFGRRVYRLMLEKSWNQSDLARAAKQPRNNISTYIRGISMPTPLNLKYLAEALDVTEDELLPNYTEAAIKEDFPEIDLRVSPADPNKGWLQVNRAVTMTTAVKIIELLNADNVAVADRG